MYRILASKELTLGLLVILCILLIPRTFTKTTDAYLSGPYWMVFAVMGLNLVLCTVQRIKTLSRTVLIMHLGAILTLAGTVVSSLGFIATVNIYEGTSVDTVYRWDIRKDSPLGFDLMVKKINLEYYPIPIRVGVKQGEKKVGLFELKTGESFRLEQYTVKADSLEFPSEILMLSIFEGGRLIGTADTEGMRNLPPDFPFKFVLVAFMNPKLKRVRADLSIKKGSHVIADGATELNSPLTIGKDSFYITKVDADRYGIRFAGIQITSDPGKPYVFSGFGVIGIGSVLHVLRKFRLKVRR